MFSTDEVQVDLDEGVDKALDRFCGLSSSYPQLSKLSLATRENLIDVAEYLFYWRSGYWDPIVKGDLLAFGIFLHELTERRWYESHNLDPFNYEHQTSYYAQSHSKALIEEHRFLAAVARIEGLEFSLRQLIEANPWGDCGSDRWEGDWAIVEKIRGHELDPRDSQVDETQSASVQQFLQRLQSAEATVASERPVSLHPATGWSALATFLCSAPTLF